MTRRTLTLKAPPAQGVPIDTIVERICDNCRFFDLTKPEAVCRKRPPYRDHVNGEGVWPVVYWNDWCGEFKRIPAQPTEGFMS